MVKVSAPETSTICCSPQDLQPGLLKLLHKGIKWWVITGWCVGEYAVAVDGEAVLVLG
jgi:hypothetical protein